MTLLFIAVLVTVFAFIYWVFVVKPEAEIKCRPLEEVLPPYQKADLSFKVPCYATENQVNRKFEYPPTPYKEADSPKKTSLELCEEYRVRQQELTQKAVEDHNKKNETWIG